MRKIFLLLFILTTISLSQSYSQASRGTVLSYTVNPASIGTGEKGFTRIKLADDLVSSDRETISIKNNQWFYVEEIKINHEENEILIWFMPLDPSLSAFPDFEIGDKIYSGIPLSVKSKLGNTNSLAVLGGKVLLPWTKLLFAAGFTLLVLFLFLFYYVIKIVPKKIRKTVFLQSNTFKRKRLLKKMSKMIFRLSKYEKTDYIKRFIKLLKEYLEIATSKKTTCFTTGEIITAYPKAPSQELVFLDFVRFGNGIADSKIISEASTTIYDFALMYEGAAGEGKI
ncbi:MAG: hypothetical protein FWE72_08180 [Spirochaetaceae bacterium]|nr:hypothetical protein [Spirochaetaceae bacterium]